jgi:hypothetical protein
MNNRVTVMPLEEKKNIHAQRGFSVFFLKKNGKMTKLTLKLKKTKAICEGVLVIFYWFCCYV